MSANADVDEHAEVSAAAAGRDGVAAGAGKAANAPRRGEGPASAHASSDRSDSGERRARERAREHDDLVAARAAVGVAVDGHPRSGRDDRRSDVQAHSVRGATGYARCDGGCDDSDGDGVPHFGEL